VMNFLAQRDQSFIGEFSPAKNNSNKISSLLSVPIAVYFELFEGSGCSRSKASNERNKRFIRQVPQA